MFDYIIIGGGTAGCVLAERLSNNPGTTVALLETGPASNSVWLRCPAGAEVLARTGNWSTQVPTIAQPGLNGRHVTLQSGQLLGGSSATQPAHWMPAQCEDYDHWAADGNAGWGADDVRPYLQKAHDQLALDPPDAQEELAIARQFLQGAQTAGYPPHASSHAFAQSGAGLLTPLHHQGQRQSAARAYLSPALVRANLRVFTDAHATRILIEHHRAVGVEFVYEGQTMQLRAAREVLLCAGAIGSPKLLMLSGIGPHKQLLQKGIATVHHLSGVGENLHDHLRLALPMRTPNAINPLALTPRGLWAFARALQQWHSTRSGLLTDNFTPAGALVSSEDYLRTPNLQVMLHTQPWAARERMLGWASGYACSLSLLSPASRGRVVLASKDPFEAPAVDPDFLGERVDMERMVRGLNLMRTILQQPAIKALGGVELASTERVRNDFEIEHHLRENAQSANHMAGTCRMGKSADDVVDGELRVHGIASLRVVDASVMPRLVSADPSATTLMIAEKAADLIQAGTEPGL